MYEKINVNKDILITYKFSDRKFSQAFKTTSDLPQEQEIRNRSASSLFHKPLTNENCSALSHYFYHCCLRLLGRTYSI